MFVVLFVKLDTLWRTEQELKQIACKDLEELYLTFIAVPFDVNCLIAQSCPNIQKLSFSGPVSADSVCKFAQFAALTEVSLSWLSTPLDDRFIDLLSANSKELRTLYMHNNTARFTDTAMINFANSACSKYLTVLSLSGVEVCDSGLIALLTVCGHNSQHLTLSHNTHLTDNTLYAIATHCVELTSLDIVGCTGITQQDSVFKVVAKCGKLTRLNIPSGVMTVSIDEVKVMFPHIRYVSYK